MSPSRALLDELLGLMAEARREGVSFEVAWRRSLDDVLGLVDSDQEIKEWRAALRETRAAWRRSYQGEPIPHADALKALAAL